MAGAVALLASLLAGPAAAQLPVNRLFTVDAGHPTPDLKCVVGFHSIDVEDTVRMNCSEAHTKSMVLKKDNRKALGWVPGRRVLTFGSQGNGSPWPGQVTSWVCATVPMGGTVTFDCIPENHAPSWFKTPMAGPAKGPGQRQVGCNGMVCYCNNADYCNLKDGYVPSSPGGAGRLAAPALSLSLLALARL